MVLINQGIKVQTFKRGRRLVQIIPEVICHPILIEGDFRTTAEPLSKKRTQEQVGTISPPSATPTTTSTTVASPTITTPSAFSPVVSLPNLSLSDTTASFLRGAEGFGSTGD